MQPHYKLDERTRDRVIKLVNTCIELELGNVSFKYYRELIDFYMLEDGNHWQLVVVLLLGKRDIYKINDGIITYEYSGSEDSENED